MSHDFTSILQRFLSYVEEAPGQVAFHYIHADGIVEQITRGDLLRRSAAVGNYLRAHAQPQDRICIALPHGPQFLYAFLGTLYARMIAVPCNLPRSRRNQSLARLQALIEDATPRLVLGTEASGPLLATEGRESNSDPAVAARDLRQVPVESLFAEPDHEWRESPTDAEAGEVAYLQYTSGSTGRPKGVMVTHGNLIANERAIQSALGHSPETVMVSWLPFFHDMGLVTALLPSLIGHYFTFMTPAAFVRRPIRWMREIARQPGDTGGTISVAPNFAFDHAAARGLPKEGEEPLDLSNVKAVLNGSEPISAATVQRFNDAFGPFGFPRKAIKPSYGLAEATLFVSTTPSSEEPKIISVDRDELNANRFVPVPDDSPKAVAQAGAGKIGVGEWAVIVDHETASELPDGQIGEIWISGNNMGTGYWNKPEKTVETFQNTLKSRTTPSHADGAADDATWVRTGDLGAYHDDELYITGRTKDLVIIDGRNHYPQDLEYSAQEASKAVRTGFAAAFSVPANQLPDEVFADAHAGLKRDPKDTSEQLVIVAERAAGSHKMEISQVADAIRAAIAVRHGVTVRDVLLTSAGAIPRTSSGKIGRSACRSAYLDGSLRSGKVANAFPDETD